ncbi:MAG: hypothetical protein ABW185_14250 [Sedimenticola sp.]
MKQRTREYEPVSLGGLTDCQERLYIEIWLPVDGVLSAVLVIAGHNVGDCSSQQF